MADIVVTLKYPNPRARVAFAIVTALMPVWGAIMPIMGVALFVLLLILGAPPNQLVLVLGIASSLLLTALFSAILFIRLADKKLLLSRDGLRLPGSSVIFKKREFNWAEISNVIFSGSLLEGKQNFAININTKSGDNFKIFAKRLSYEDLEQLVLALELWAEPGTMDDKISFVKDELQVHLHKQISSSEHSGQSYTEIWEEELERRFNSTAFMVLEPDASLRSGELVIVRQLSFGGLSAIYLCQQNKRELMVLKESVVPADANDELRQQAEQMFEREAKFLMKLAHPNIVKVNDYFVERGRNYLLLEHINGADLRQFVIKNGPLTENRVWQIARTLTEVLKYLHEQNPCIIHRDLTPDNIVLENGRVVKVIDFGAANEFIGTATGTLIGKQSYLPLEQLRGKAVPQSDIYALGCTLFFLLTGEDPEPLAVVRVRSVRHELSEALDEFIAACTDADYKKRPASAADILDRLAAQAT